jgi:fructokinase
LQWTPPIEAIVAQAGHLHVMGTLSVHENLWHIIEPAARVNKACGGTISLDPHKRKELKTNDKVNGRFEKTITQTDLVLTSRHKVFIAANLMYGACEAAPLDRLSSLGVSEIVLKCGVDGFTCFQSDGATTHAAAFQVDKVDPTGPGDCFYGAYMACRRLGLCVDEALVHANAAGARNITERGPTEGACARAKPDPFIATTKRPA